MSRGETLICQIADTNENPADGRVTAHRPRAVPCKGGESEYSALPTSSPGKCATAENSRVSAVASVYVRADSQGTRLSNRSARPGGKEDRPEHPLVSPIHEKDPAGRLGLWSCAVAGQVGIRFVRPCCRLLERRLPGRHSSSGITSHTAFRALLLI